MFIPDRSLPREEIEKQIIKRHDADRRISDENHARKTEVFGNTYLHPAIEVRDEVQSRLKKIGIFREPECRLVGLEGKMIGPAPVSEAANYIEKIARELYNRGSQGN